MRFDENTIEPTQKCWKSGKTCFAKKDALSKKNFLEKLGKEKELRVYHCPDCNYHHLTKRV